MDQLAALGPFFALADLDPNESDPSESDPSEPDPRVSDPWQPLAALRSPEILDDRVGQVSRSLYAYTGEQVAPRVAASTMSLGLFARLVAPQLGAATLRLRLPALSWDHTYWQPTTSAPWPLAHPTGTPDGDHNLTTALTEILFPLAELISERYSLSLHVLHGNIASGVFGAISMMRQTRPDLTQVALAHGSALLASELAGTGTLVNGLVTGLAGGRARAGARGRARGDSARTGFEFRRNSCCLYYRIPGGGYCGDCILRPRPTDRLPGSAD